MRQHTKKRNERLKAKDPTANSCWWCRGRKTALKETKASLELHHFSSSFFFVWCSTDWKKILKRSSVSSPGSAIISKNKEFSPENCFFSVRLRTEFRNFSISRSGCVRHTKAQSTLRKNCEKFPLFSGCSLDWLCVNNPIHPQVPCALSFSPVCASEFIYSKAKPFTSYFHPAFCEKALNSSWVAHNPTERDWWHGHHYTFT